MTPFIEMPPIDIDVRNNSISNITELKRWMIANCTVYYASKRAAYHLKLSPSVEADFIIINLVKRCLDMEKFLIETEYKRPLLVLKEPPKI